jgi:hypothetical protein
MIIDFTGNKNNPSPSELFGYLKHSLSQGFYVNEDGGVVIGPLGHSRIISESEIQIMIESGCVIAESKDLGY